MDNTYTKGILRFILFGLKQGQKEFGFTYESSKILYFKQLLEKHVPNNRFELSTDMDPESHQEITVYLVFEP